MIAQGASVFVDANTFVYHWGLHPAFLASHDADFDRLPGLTRYAPA